MAAPSSTALNDYRLQSCILCQSAGLFSSARNSQGKGWRGEEKEGSLKYAHYGNKTHLLPPMTAIRIVVRVVIRVRKWVIIREVWVCIIISTSWSVTAFRRHYSILRKSDPTNRIGIKKMIFPSFNSLPIHSLIK